MTGVKMTQCQMKEAILTMPSKQFLRLPQEKQDKVMDALFHEFTTHSLADACVARIVTETGIARGTFYNYFTDLQEAYTYLFGLEMAKIHRPFDLTMDTFSVDEGIQQVDAFLTEVDQQQLRQLLIFHFQTNEGLLQQDHRQDQWQEHQQVSALMWAVKTLIHQAINEALMNPSQEKQILQRLKFTLNRLQGGD